jgi:hypothetical protein
MAAQSKTFMPRPDLVHPEIVDEASDPRPLAQLRAVHDEALETSRLANLLGRTLYLGMLLPVLLLAALLLAAPPLTRALSFGAIVLMGVGALSYACRNAMGAPFERQALKKFSADLDAILLYIGFAWGAGAFLILPANTEPATAVLFSACTAALVASVVREREAVLMFAAPAGLLTALAAFLRPLELAPATAALAVMACFFVAGSAALSSWMKERAARWPAPVDAHLA